MVLDRDADLKKVVTLSMTQPKTFVYEDNTSIGAKWEMWLAEYEAYLDACGVKADIQKIGILWSITGNSVRDIYRTSTKKKEDDEYNAVIAILNEHFKSKTNKLYEVFKLSEMKQGKQEMLEDFHIREEPMDDS